MADKKQKKTENPKKEQDKSTTRFMIGGFIALLLILAALFGVKYIYTPKEKDTGDSYIYNGFAFQKLNGLWHTQVQIKGANNVYDVPLHFGPKELDTIYLTGNKNTFNFYMARYGYDNETKQGFMVVTFDPTEKNLSYTALAAGELTLNLAQGLNLETVGACTVNATSACESRPIINCDNNFKLPIIYLKTADESKVEINGNCIIVQGKDEGLLKSADRLILTLYGIMSIEKHQSYLYLYGAKKNDSSSIDIDVGIYDQSTRCAWIPGQLNVQVLDGSSNVIAQRTVPIANEDQFLDYCVTKKPVSITLSAEELAKAKYVNGTFFIDSKNRTLETEKAVTINVNGKK